MVVISKEIRIILLCSSRVASRGIAIADSHSDDLFGTNAPDSSDTQLSAVNEHPLSSASGASSSAFSRLKERLNGFWLYSVQRWPTVLFTFYYLGLRK